MEPESTTSLLAQAFAQAPVYIQEFVRSGKYDQFIDEVRTTQNLHIDVLDNVSDEILMMLLGMAEPRELLDNLTKEAGLTDEQAAAVITLANQKVFSPLQEEMRKASAVKPEPLPVRAQASSAPTIPTAPVPALGMPSRMDAPAPVVPALVPTYVPLTPPAPLPAAPVAPVPAPMPESPTLPSVPTEPTMRTMAHDVESMKAGGAPGPVPYAAPVVEQPPAPQPVMPAASASVMPPAPSVPPSQVHEAPALSRTISRTPAPDINEVTDTLKKYGIDPYREPPE